MVYTSFLYRLRADGLLVQLFFRFTTLAYHIFLFATKFSAGVESDI